MHVIDNTMISELSSAYMGFRHRRYNIAEGEMQGLLLVALGRDGGGGTYSVLASQLTVEHASVVFWIDRQPHQPRLNARSDCRGGMALRSTNGTPAPRSTNCRDHRYGGRHASLAGWITLVLLCLGCILQPQMLQFVCHLDRVVAQHTSTLGQYFAPVAFPKQTMPRFLW